jgi:purine nucleosidase
MCGMKITKMLLGCAAVVAMSVNCFAGEVPRIILDTDMATDIDDVGAVAVLHHLADEGKCEILAMGSSTRGNGSVAALEVMNGLAGREVPIGGYRPVRKEGEKKCRVDDGCRAEIEGMIRRHARYVKHGNADEAPDAVGVYRKALAGAADGSVTFICIGYLSNVARLLKSAADEVSGLTGKELVARKVKCFYVMGCTRKAGGSEWNVQGDVGAAKFVLEEAGVPIVVSDFELGKDILTGEGVGGVVGEVYPKGHRHQSWDPVTVVAAICPEYFVVERGRYRIVGARGENEWVADEKERGGRLNVKGEGKDLVGIVNGLMGAK